jgi:hypothetical protein
MLRTGIAQAGLFMAVDLPWVAAAWLPGLFAAISPEKVVFPKFLTAVRCQQGPKSS